MQSVSKLPGIYFHTELRPVTTDLPRMDVAGFVGFAGKGPLHIPVLIEDIARFRDIFGDDIALAWDNTLKKVQFSLLGSTVELFFRNGGQRCWIVRVAAESSDDNNSNDASNIGAHLQQFNLPGLYSRNEFGLKPVQIFARSAGSWADKLKVATRLQVNSLIPNWPLNTSSSAINIFSAAINNYSLQIKAAPADLRIGDLIEIKFTESQLKVYFFVDHIQSVESGVTLQAKYGYWFEEIISSPEIVSPAEEVIENKLALEEVDAINRYNSIEGQCLTCTPTIRYLSFEILVLQGESLLGQLSKLAFDKRHPRFWGNIPNDEKLFGKLLNTNPVNLDVEFSEFLSELIFPRFPLAANEESQVQNFHLPLTMTTSISSDSAVTAIGDSDDSSIQARNGLTLFSADLFLDKDLAKSTSTTLLREAEYKQSISNKNLKGIYSLFPIDEISMISVPDIVHRHWGRDPQPFESGIMAPVLEALSIPDEYDNRHLYWNKIPGVRRYIIQQSLTSDFDEVVEYINVKPTRLEVQNDELNKEPDHNIKIFLDQQCPQIVYFRVRAEGYKNISPWSNTRAARIPESGFYSCERPDPSLLGLTLEKLSISPAEEKISLSWYAEDTASLVESIADNFELQQATNADFVSSIAFELITNQNIDVDLQFDVNVYYRVRAWVSDTPGPWSNTIVVAPDVLSSLTLAEIKNYDDQDLLAVHYSLIRLCSVRGNAIAILSAPSHYQEENISVYMDSLNPPDNRKIQLLKIYGSGEIYTQSLSWYEREALSFAVFYYPWLSITAHQGSKLANNNDTNRLIPADGAVSGKIAITAIKQGAWHSSANRSLQDVLGLSPSNTEKSLAALSLKQINVIGEVPHGYVVINSNTLSLSKEFRPLNVRRLMILLRRLILREGNSYVFDSNNAVMRANVQRYWELILTDLYQRGALQGNSADEAFRIITDESVNDQRNLDRGRFIINLQVAPVQPLSFINVRLLQNGSDQLVLQEL